MDTKELAEAFSLLSDDEKIKFLREISSSLRKGVEVSSPLFNSSCYIGIAANWLEKSKE